MQATANALNAQVTGTGDALVLIHGFGSDQNVWVDYVPWLARRYRVITYDLPFAGATAPGFFDARRHTNPDGHVQDLVDVLRSFDVQNCSVIGHSMGGLIGLLAAVDHPAIFRKLILIGTSARYLDDTGYHGGLDTAALEALFEALATNFRTWAESAVPALVGRPSSDPASQTFLDSLLRTRPDTALAMVRPLLLGDYREALTACRVPTAILQTEDDPFVPIEAALVLQQCLKGSSLDILKASGHLPHLSAPEEVRAALSRHLPRLQDSETVSCRG